MNKNVYVNRTLNLRKISHLGFDMDHTLIRYNSKNFENSTHDIVIEKLIQGKNYPEEIRHIHFNYDLAIRGLVMDKKKGNLLKLSRYGAIRASYHGLKPIDYSVQKKIYGSKYVDLRDGNYSSIDTAFSISTAQLFAHLVDLKEQKFSSIFPDFETIANDLMNAVDDAHRDGSLKNIVKKNLDKYIIREEEVARGLERYRRHDKKLFLLTNSDFNYTKLLLDYAINPFLKDFKHWSELFEIIIVKAQKPRFFYDNLNFLKVNPIDGSMLNHEGPLVPGIYQGGCANIFTKDLYLEGENILYIGDHIYGDILRLKKDCNWRTAMVLEGLEDEIEKYKLAEPFQEKISKLMKKKEPLEEQYVELISKDIENGKKDASKEILRLQKEISNFDKQIGELIPEQQRIFNPYWGEMMRAGNEESYFSYQIDRFACIYMAKLADLLAFSPRTYFRALRKPLAHELMLKD